MRRQFVKSRRTHPCIDSEAALAIPGSDIFAIGLGWLLSLHGFVFLVFCTVGFATGLNEIYRSVNNSPIEITASDLCGATTGRNVKIFGSIDSSKSVIGKRGYGSESFTLTAMKSDGNNVIIYTPSLIPDSVKLNPIDRWYEGELTVLEHGSGKIDGATVPVRSLFIDIKAKVSDSSLVIADSVIPTFRWWYLLVTGLCFLGLLYILYRLISSVLFVLNRDAALKYLFRNVT